MPITGSGEISLYGDIAVEYSVAATNVSLRNLSSCASLTVPDAMSEFYGLSDVELPSVSTLTATSVTSDSMIIRGCVTNTGGENVSRGFYHGTNSTYSSNTKYTATGTHGTGLYCCTRTGLSGGTTYYHTAFACNAAGESVGNTCSQLTSFAATFTNWSVPSQSTTGFVSFVNQPGTYVTAGGYNQYYNPVTSTYVNIKGTTESSPTPGVSNFGWSFNYGNTCFATNTRNRSYWFASRGGSATGSWGVCLTNGANGYFCANGGTPTALPAISNQGCSFSNSQAHPSYPIGTGPSGFCFYSTACRPVPSCGIGIAAGYFCWCG